VTKSSKFKPEKKAIIAARKLSQATQDYRRTTNVVMKNLLYPKTNERMQSGFIDIQFMNSAHAIALNCMARVRRLGKDESFDFFQIFFDACSEICEDLEVGKKELLDEGKDEK